MKLVSIISLIAVISCSSAHKEKKEIYESAVAEMHSATMESIKGNVTLDNDKGYIKVRAKISGLKPSSKLGFHIHENGVCEGPDYKSAGGHFAPHSKKHGKEHSTQSHMGDMGNIVTNANGDADKTILIPKLHDHDFQKIIGKAIIIHAGEDDLKTQPSGASGARIACGLIKPVNDN